jgi:hypothetical protein
MGERSSFGSCGKEKGKGCSLKSIKYLYQVSKKR